MSGSGASLSYFFRRQRALFTKGNAYSDSTISSITISTESIVPLQTGYWYISQNVEFYSSPPYNVYAGACYGLGCNVDFSATGVTSTSTTDGSFVTTGSSSTTTSIAVSSSTASLTTGSSVSTAAIIITSQHTSILVFVLPVMWMLC